MKLLVINNLKSGYGEGAVYDFIRSFVSDGDEVCMRSTDGSTEVATMLYDADRFDAVVASGGDGTVAAVSYALSGSGIPVLPFPAGTANLLALNLQSPNEPHALAKMIRAGLMLDFDLGEMEVAGKSFGFVIMAGAGYDAAIMRDAKPHKRVWGPMAYFSAAIANAAADAARAVGGVEGEPSVQFTDVTAFGFTGNVVVWMEEGADPAAAKDAVVRAVAPLTRIVLPAFDSGRYRYEVEYEP